MKKSNQYELIVVLVNGCFTETVINTARKNGASGGTIVSASASANKNAQDEYGVSIVTTSDKDVIMMLVDEKNKKQTIDAIYNVSGIQTKGMAIIFTIPVDNLTQSKKQPVDSPNEVKASVNNTKKAKKEED